MAWTRRFFLKASGLALVGLGPVLGQVPGFLLRAANRVPARRRTLVVVFLRGAADGLNIVVPHSEKAYYRLRPSIAIPRPRRGRTDGAFDLDGRFGLHPALGGLEQLYRRKMLAVIPAAGSPDATRSHFDAQDFMESGTPGVKSTRDGWLNRYLKHEAGANPSDFRAVSTTTQLPRILTGTAPALAIPELSRFGFRSGPMRDLAQRGLAELYAVSGDPLLTDTALRSFEAVEQLERIDPGRYEPEHDADYPPGRFGKSMRQIAQLIKADLGLEIAFVELGGWDHHVNEGGVEGSLATLLRQLDRGIAALFRDLGDRAEDVALATCSEFGRTAAENGNRGTDHGHAGHMFVVGGRVQGGQVYGSWPGLDRDQLYEGRDLALATDFRTVFGTILHEHLGAERLEAVFPGYAFDGQAFAGLIG